MGVLNDKATPRGAYPHVKRAGDFIFVSGTSSRLPDNSFAGVHQVDEMGTMRLDVREQTRAVLENIQDYLATEGATMASEIDLEEAKAELAEANARVTSGVKDRATLERAQHIAMAKVAIATQP